MDLCGQKLSLAGQLAEGLTHSPAKINAVNHSTGCCDLVLSCMVVT